MGRWLAQRGVRAITVACNTATVAAVQELCHIAHVPVVAIEPAIKPAAALTRTGVVGVLATQHTIQSESVARLVALHGQRLRFVLQACPGWVEQVEQGDLTSETTHRLVRQHTRPLVHAGADVWVLGCTHYPYLMDVLRSVSSPDVQWLDPAQAVARELVRRLPATSLSCGVGSTRFFTTGSVPDACRVMSLLWGKPVQALPIAA
ncbi:MAG: aspartate/glutamate racemase family protein [Alphaproteobacteria bacterium]|nr:aspartate/glutamate racemase family protein [Alphaproteobacteria bacterium]